MLNCTWHGDFHSFQNYFELLKFSLFRAEFRHINGDESSRCNLIRGKNMKTTTGFKRATLWILRYKRRENTYLEVLKPLNILPGL